MRTVLDLIQNCLSLSQKTLK